VSKQRPRIRARDTSAAVRPTREAFVEALHNPQSASPPYPRARRAPLRADVYFSPRAGTELNQITPSYGVGEAHRYGRGDVFNVGSLGDTGTPGSQMQTTSRYRIGELPTRRGSRKRPPRDYGTKTDNGTAERSGPHTAPLDGVHQYIEQQSETSENQFRKPLLVGNVTQPRSRRPSRRQGALPLDPTHKQAANIEGQLHVSGYLGSADERRRRRKRAKLMAKKVELLCLHDLLKGEQIAKARAQARAVEEQAIQEVLHKQHQQEQALAQADEALRAVDASSKFVPGFHTDNRKFWNVWKRATELVEKEEQAQQVTMKGLK
jgi:hypothetical protein